MKQPKNKAETTFLEALLQDESARIDFAGAALEVDVQAQIAEVMEANDVSQAELGRRLGISRSRINQVVSGDPKNLTLGLVGRIGEALNAEWRIRLERKGAIPVSGLTVAPGREILEEFAASRVPVLNDIAWRPGRVEGSFRPSKLEEMSITFAAKVKGTCERVVA